MNLLLTGMERDEAYTCDLKELNFFKRVNKTFGEHLKLYLPQYLEDQEAVCRETVSQEPYDSYFVPASLTFIKVP